MLGTAHPTTLESSAAPQNLNFGVLVVSCYCHMTQRIPTLQHRPIGSVSDSKHMRRHFMSLDALVSLHDLLCVDGQPFVWVHHNTEEARVRLETKNADIIHSINTESTKSMCLFICLFVTERSLDSTVQSLSCGFLTSIPSRGKRCFSSAFIS